MDFEGYEVQSNMLEEAIRSAFERQNSSEPR